MFSIILTLASASVVQAELQQEAIQAAKSATRFLTDSLSTEGGYLWRYSADLSLREGEGIVETQTVWVQPPGTPAVGEAFVRLYQTTGDPQFRAAALAAAAALHQGQMRSGGWQDRVEFEPQRRKKWAYRSEPSRSKAKDQSSLDDDKTQSAIRFLIQLDQATEFREERVHEMTMTALQALIGHGQFRNGGFPQVWMDQRTEIADALQPAAARYPDSWPREYPGHRQYWTQYTLNDNLASDVMKTLFLAENVYDDSAYRVAALRLADSLLTAQMPLPQPAWAQQYNSAFEPIWARKFEPPAISGGESQTVMETLLLAYERSGQAKYLDAVRPALEYLEASVLPDGRLARFYELQTNRPLYFNRDYELTYDDSDCPTHYAFKVSNQLERIRAQYERLKTQTSKAPGDRAQVDKANPVSTKRIQQLIATQDPRGAWVTQAGLRYHRYNGAVIEMAVMVKHLNQIADFLSRSDR
ncbi:MAG: pectate lyase [Novipirellula sp. JB048]